MGIFFVTAVTLIYLMATFFLDYGEQVVPVLNAMRFITSMAVLALYTPAALSSLRKRAFDSADFLIVGIALTWLSAVMFAVSSELVRLINIDPLIFTIPVVGFFGVVLVMGGVFHMSAPAFVTKWRLLTSLLLAIGAFFAFRLAVLFM